MEEDIGRWATKAATFSYIDNRPKRWQTTPEIVEGYQLTNNNIDDVARWCGGLKGDIQTHDQGVVSRLTVPSVEGSKHAVFGDYVVKNASTGRFLVLSQGEFDSKGFHEVGLRQDGPQIRTAPHTINVKGSGEAYGAYADPRYQVAHDVLDMS